MFQMKHAWKYASLSIITCSDLLLRALCAAKLNRLIFNHSEVKIGLCYVCLIL